MAFKDKTIWIIGASEGIGAALARAFAREGGRLILSARNVPALEKLASECGGAQVLPLDLAQPGALAAACTGITPGSLDAVICTAALYDPGLVSDLSPEALARVVSVNLLGSFDVARLSPPLIRFGGQLVLFGSVAGYLGLPGGQPYSATKAAVNNLAETLRIELAPRVDVRLVCPGFVSTRLTQKNAFTMPAIITPEAAAQAVIKGLQTRAFELHFPKRFTFAMKLLRLMPYALSLRLTARLTVKRHDP